MYHGITGGEQLRHVGSNKNVGVVGAKLFSFAKRFRFEQNFDDLYDGCVSYYHPWQLHKCQFCFSRCV